LLWSATINASPEPNESNYLSGFTGLYTDGTYLMGVYQKNTGPAGFSGREPYHFHCDPANPLATYKNYGRWQTAMERRPAYDPVGGHHYMGSSDEGYIGWFKWGASPWVWSDWDYAGTWDQALPCGVAWCPVNGHAYWVQQSPILLKSNAAKIWNSSWDWVNTGVGNATPINIRYRPFDQQLYIPNWQDNTVTVLDPITDTVSAVKTGFTSPIDVVFTPTKAFAVQDSTVGLLEIT
jgi:YVTN family beta-propeller protein